jgi:hypothetical protein
MREAYLSLGKACRGQYSSSREFDPHPIEAEAFLLVRQYFDAAISSMFRPFRDPSIATTTVGEENRKVMVRSQ